MTSQESVRIFEIFTSLEGEGILYGTKTLFVRLAGCPFACFYCDTKEALPADSGKEYAVSEACSMIDQSLQPGTYKVNFTGGDPLMQPGAVASMAKHIQSRNVRTYLESSCFDSARFARVLPHIDLIKIELKTRDAKFADDKHYPILLENALKCLQLSMSSKKSAYVKIVASSRTSPEHMAWLARRVFETADPEDIGGFVIQPAYGAAEPGLDLLMKMYDAVLPYYENVRVVPQLHKLIGAP